MDRDQKYLQIPWKDGGRTPDGLDCVGLVKLWLRDELGMDFEAPATPLQAADKHQLAERYLEPKSCSTCKRPTTWHKGNLPRGHIIFFRNRSGQLCHVGISLGRGQILHMIRGLNPRIDNGYSLIFRGRLTPAFAISPLDAARLTAALANPAIKDFGISAAILIVLSIALSAASYFLMPKLSRLGNKTGRYGFDALVTQNSPEIPLPDLLGKVTVAGNSPYTQLADKHAAVDNTPPQKASKIVVLCSGPAEQILYDSGLKINGLGWSDRQWNDGSSTMGFWANPAQTKAEAMDGTIVGDSHVPSFTTYTGAYGVSVPVDVRAQYDRGFPIYGLSGCSYIVFRLINGTKFSGFNMTCEVKGRRCRKFTSSGFVVSSDSDSLTGDGTTKRFKLSQDDVQAITSITVNSVAYTLMAPGNQTGNVYHLNKTKGFVEFLTAPGNTLAIEIEYDYYEREWTQNPAMHAVYMLTEQVRGKGAVESKVDWPRATTFKDYCDADVTWVNSSGSYTQDRYRSNYAIDFRKPIQEHIRAILDASLAYLFVSGGKFVLRPRTTDSSVFSLTPATILAGTFKAEKVDRSTRSNRVKLIFQSDTQYNAEDEVIADDEDSQATRANRAGNNGIVDENLKFPAVTDQIQAERLAEILLSEQVNSLWVIECSTNIKGLALEPGDIVDITHPAMPGWDAKLFRIETLDYDSLDRLKLTASEYFSGAYSDTVGGGGGGGEEEGESPPSEILLNPPALSCESGFHDETTSMTFVPPSGGTPRLLVTSGDPTYFPFQGIWIQQLWDAWLIEKAAQGYVTKTTRFVWSQLGGQTTGWNANLAMEMGIWITLTGSNLWTVAVEFCLEDP